MQISVKTKIPFLWPLGPGGLLAPDRVVAVGNYHSAPIRRLVRRARNTDRLIDLTYGQAVLWVIFLDSGHLALAAEPMPVTTVDENTWEKYIEHMEKRSA